MDGLRRSRIGTGTVFEKFLEAMPWGVGVVNAL